jgi:hypothetical protein
VHDRQSTYFTNLKKKKKNRSHWLHEIFIPLKVCHQFLPGQFLLMFSSPLKWAEETRILYPTLKIEFIDGIKFIGHKCANKLTLCKKLTQVKKDQRVDLKKTFNKKENK